MDFFSLLPDEMILAVGHALLLAASPNQSQSSSIAGIVAAARSCKRLHRLLLGLAYREAIARDSSQQLLRMPPPVTSLALWPWPSPPEASSPPSAPNGTATATATTVLTSPMPVVLWAAEHNRLDTFARLIEAEEALARRKRTTGSRQTKRRRMNSRHSEGEEHSHSHHAQQNPTAPLSPSSFPPPSPAPSSSSILISAFWYPLPPSCQHDLSHMRWRPRPWYLEQGPDAQLPSPPLESGWCTALHLAAQHGHRDFAARLLERGAAVDAAARHVCVCGSGHMRLVVQDEGVRDPDDAPVATPLHVALANGRDDVARLLVGWGADWSTEVLHLFDTDHAHGVPGVRSCHYAEVMSGEGRQEPEGGEGVEVAEYGVEGGNEVGSLSSPTQRRRLAPYVCHELWCDDPHNLISTTITTAGWTPNRDELSTAADGPDAPSNSDSNIVILKPAIEALPKKLLSTRRNQDGGGTTTATTRKPPTRYRAAALHSNRGRSYGATGLRIAASNAMLPFLAWLVCTGRTLRSAPPPPLTTAAARRRASAAEKEGGDGDGQQGGGRGDYLDEERGRGGGEFWDDDRDDDIRRGALHFAAHASAVVAFGHDMYLCGLDDESTGVPITSFSSITSSSRRDNADVYSKEDDRKLIEQSEQQGTSDAIDAVPSQHPDASAGHWPPSRPGPDAGHHPGSISSGQQHHYRQQQEEHAPDPDPHRDGDHAASADKARMRAVMEQLVALLLALGVDSPAEQDDDGAARAELVAYARRWGNDALADVLEGVRRCS